MIVSTLSSTMIIRQAISHDNSNLHCHSFLTDDTANLFKVYVKKRPSTLQYQNVVGCTDVNGDGIFTE